MTTAQVLVMPKLGLTMTEGTITTWRAKAGERFAAGDVLVVVETDKVAYDVEAPQAGVLDHILIDETQTVPVGTPIAEWRAGGTELPAAPARPGRAPAAAPEPKPIAAPAPAMRDTPRGGESSLPGGRRISTPLARRMARENGLDLARITGSGPRGRIQAADIEGAIAARGSEAKVAVAASGSISAPTATERTMAERLSAAKRDIPHFYLSIDIEVSATLAARTQLNDLPGRPRVSMTHLIVAAAVHGLGANPLMNRIWTDGGIRTLGEVDIGIAVDTERGLMNPVVRNLGGASFYGLVRKVDDVIARARHGALKPDDFGGGALTISNAGMHDVRYMASIIVPGQSAILGIGSVQECFRPDADGAPLLRRELGVVFSGDHRIHTGVSALAFLATLREALSAPMRLLMSMGQDWGSR